MPTNPSSELECGDEVPPSPRDHGNKLRRTRNLVGFWLLGLCNNYAYVVMLSAAFDILNKEVGPHNVTVDPHPPNNTRCNPTSTGAILLADILPALFIKLTAPFLSINTSIQVAAVVLLSSSSFLMTSFTIAKWMSFLGVICAALGSGLGEITFLAYSSHFDTDVISTWSSGTGGAGVLGAFSYAALASVLTPETTLLVMLFVPVLLAISFWGILVHPKIRARQPVDVAVPDEEPLLLSCSGCSEDGITTLTFVQKLKLIKPLLRFMIPLGFVYFAEYFINQGLLELIVFRNTKLTHKEQYRWLQVMYQVGVLISRSSVNIIQIRKLWLLPILQLPNVRQTAKHCQCQLKDVSSFANVAFIFSEAYLLFLPSFWIVVVVVLYEGLLGGAAYVNTFYRISKDVVPQHREFSLRIASLADSTGIALAGAVALPVHDAMCLLSY